MTGVMDLVATAKAGIDNLSPAQVASELERGDLLLVDLERTSASGSGYRHRQSADIGTDADGDPARQRPDRHHSSSRVTTRSRSQTRTASMSRGWAPGSARSSTSTPLVVTAIRPANEMCGAIGDLRPTP